MTGDEIRAARQRARLTQDELGEMIGVTGRTIGNWERGTSVPRNRKAALEEALSGMDDDPDQVGLLSASDAQLVAEIARRFARTQEARHATQAEDEAGSDPDVQGTGTGTAIDLAQARKVKDDPATFGDQPRMGDLDQGKLQPPPAARKSAAYEPDEPLEGPTEARRSSERGEESQHEK